MKKFILSCLCLALVLPSMTGCSKQTETKQVTKEIQIETNQATGSTLSKDETVYVMCNGDGSVDSIVVSNWIKNGLKQETIKDQSSLNNVQVTKGNSNYTISQDQIVWDAKGGDIYYQGESNQKSKLPVSLSISYLLNGKPMSLDELEGKSGKLEIQIHYQNNEKHIVKIDGKDTELYVPFVMLSGLLLDDSFSNVTVSNGKLVQMDGKTAVVGFALPGMDTNLGSLSSQIDLPDEVIIHADVNQMNVPTMMSMVTNSLFNELEIDKVDSLDDLRNQMNELDDGFKQLMDGSSKLYDGMCTLMESADPLVKAIYTLANGTKQLQSGSNELYNGSISLRDNLKNLSDGTVKLQAGSSTLKDGLNLLSSNSQALNAGAKLVFNSLIENVQDNLNESSEELKALGVESIPTLNASNFEKEIDAIIAVLDEKHVLAAIEKEVMNAVVAVVDLPENQKQLREAVTSAVHENVEMQVKETVKNVIEQKVTASVKETVEKQVKQAVMSQVRDQILQQANCTLEQYSTNEQVKTMIDGQVAQQMETEQVQQLIQTNTNEQMKSDEIQMQINAAVEQQMNTKEAMQQIESNTEATMNSAEVKNLIEQNIQEQRQGLISSNYEIELEQYLNSTEGKNKVSSVTKTATKLVKAKASIVSYRDQFLTSLLQYTNGVDQAATGANDLYNGIVTVSSGANQLYQGSITLTDGIKTLKEGLDTLDQGVNELNTKVQALPAGISQLKDGSMQLSDGIQEIYHKGISKILDLVNTDVDGAIDRFKAMKDLSDQYNTFSGSSKNMDGNVKFIFKLGK